MNGLREHFLLRDDVHYLNHGSFGACPRPVFDEYQRLQRELESEPVDFLALERSFPGRLAAARSDLAGELGAAADDLVLVTNATVGVNTVARSLVLTPGDEVLTTDHEYGAALRTLTFVCEHAGARVVRCPLPYPAGDPDAVVDALMERVTRRTRLLFFSHVTSPTAVLLPAGRIIRRARERGIATLVDGAHAPGQIPLDLDGLGADYYTGNCHKWLLAPKSAAFLHVRRDRQDRIDPLVVSWGWRSDTPGPSRFVDEHGWSGTTDPSAFLAVPAALEFRRRHRWEAVAAACRERLQALMEDWPAPAGREGPWFEAPGRLQMATLPVAADDPAWLQQRLRAAGVEVPVVAFGGRIWVRVSWQAYNSDADVVALLAVLREAGALS